MAIGVAYNSHPSHISHKFLIGSPLLLISIFCFGYMAVAPHPYRSSASSQGRPKPYGNSGSATSNSSLTQLPKLSLEVVPVSSSQPSTNLDSTTSPQASQQTSNSASSSLTVMPPAQTTQSSQSGKTNSTGSKNNNGDSKNLLKKTLSNIGH